MRKSIKQKLFGNLSNYTINKSSEKAEFFFSFILQGSASHNLSCTDRFDWIRYYSQIPLTCRGQVIPDSIRLFASYALCRTTL